MAPLGLGGLWPGPLPAASAASAAGAEAMKTAQNSSFRGFLIVFFFLKSLVTYQHIYRPHWIYTFQIIRYQPMGQYHIIQKQLVLYFTIFHYISLKHESAKDLQKAFVTLWEFFNHWHRRNGHFVFISFLNVWSPFEWPVFMGAGQSQVGDQMCRGTAASAAVPRCFQFSFHIFHIFHIVFGSFFYIFWDLDFHFSDCWDGRVKCIGDGWDFDAQSVDTFELRPLLRLPDKSSPFANFDTFGWRWRPSAISRSSHPRAVPLGFLELTAFTRIELLGPWEFEWYSWWFSKAPI